MLKLTFKAGDIAEVELNQPRLTVGRDEINDIVLQPTGVSGFHAEIHCEQGQVFLVDLGSSNGTFVNGKRLTGRQELKAWDTLRFESVEAEIIDSAGRRPTAIGKAITDEDLKSMASGGATQLRAAVGGWNLLGKDAPVTNKTYPLTGTLVLGREADCDITVELSQVSRRHAEISVTGNVVTVQDLGSSNGTFVNGQKVTRKTLKAGDEIKIDQVRFVLQGPAAAGNATQLRSAVGSSTQKQPAAGTMAMSALSARLLGQSGAFSGKNFPLEGKSRSLGRTGENDIVLDNSTVSGKHARLTVENGGWIVEDLGSTNGSFVNGKKIERQQLKSGDQLRFGKIEMKFESLGTAGAGTSVMSAVGDDTPTRASQQKKKKPAWVWGLVGFVVVGAIFAIFIGQDKISTPPQVTAKLQGSKVWSQKLADNRQGPATPVLADINGDGFLDVIVADANGFVLAMDGLEGKKIFEAEVADRILAAPVAGDLSGDNIDDLVIASNSGTVIALNGKGQTLWKTADDLELGQIINRPVLADVNNDKIVDVLVPTSNKGLVALDGSHGWEIWNTAEMTTGNVITAPLKADLNNDGTDDFVLLTDTGQVLAVTSQQGKLWRLWEAQTTPSYFASPALVQVNSKESLIIIATDKGGVIALNGQTGRNAWINNLQKRFFASPVAVDVDGDQVDDVVVVATNGDIHVLNGLTGEEIWSAGLGANVQASPALFDVSGDGRADLFLLDTLGNLSVVDGDRGRTVLTTKLSNQGFISSPVLGDINNDGLLELVSASPDGQIINYGINRTVVKGDAPWPAFLGPMRGE